MSARSATLDFKEVIKRVLYYNACINRPARFRRLGQFRITYKESKKVLTCV